MTPVVWINSHESEIEQEKNQKRKLDSKLLLKGGVYCGLIIFVSSTLQQMGILHTTVGKAN